MRISYKHAWRPDASGKLKCRFCEKLQDEKHSAICGSALVVMMQEKRERVYSDDCRPFNEVEK